MPAEVETKFVGWVRRGGLWAAVVAAPSRGLAAIKARRAAGLQQPGPVDYLVLPAGQRPAGRLESIAG